MTRINLLPWRAELRRQQKLEFLAIMGVCAVLTLFGVGIYHVLFQGDVDYQLQRNQFLGSEIEKLDRQIKEIKEIEKEKERLIARMKAIEGLQGSRPLIVHILDELVASLPEGVYLTDIQQQGANFEITGVAQSNARVSSFMRNIEKSKWLQDPRLEVIETTEQGGRHSSTFKLRATQMTPRAEAAAPKDDKL